MERGFPLSKALYEQLEFPFVHWKAGYSTPWIGWIGELFILELAFWGNVIRCYFYSYLGNFLSSLNPACELVHSQWSVFVPNETSTLSRWIENVGNSSLSATLQIYKSNFRPYRTAQTQSNITHFLWYIASSKHGWEPIRARVTWVLFYKFNYSPQMCH